MIKVGPDVMKFLRGLKKKHGVQSYNKALKREFNITKDGSGGAGRDASHTTDA